VERYQDYRIETPGTRTLFAKADRIGLQVAPLAPFFYHDGLPDIISSMALLGAARTVIAQEFHPHMLQSFFK
jgi:hypothetical protein